MNQESDLHDQPEEGIALCLSGGGYRAMLFHIGAILRLNETATLRKIRRISSVSGGSITAGKLGLNWNRLIWNDQDRAINLNEKPGRTYSTNGGYNDRSRIHFGWNPTAG